MSSLSDRLEAARREAATGQGRHAPAPADEGARPASLVEEAAQRPSRDHAAAVVAEVAPQPSRDTLTPTATAAGPLAARAAAAGVATDGRSAQRRALANQEEDR